MLEVGSSFPDFSLPDQNGKTHNLAQYAGSWLVIYFYPKDNTSGCSNEAQDFAELYNAFERRGAVVIGVSPDSEASHKNFSAKLELPFALLSDPEHILLAAAGVWQKKKLYGREYMGVVRSTFLLNPKGEIKAAWEKVKVMGHAQSVLLKLEEVSALN